MKIYGDFADTMASLKRQAAEVRQEQRLRDFRRKINRRQARHDKLLVRFCAGCSNGKIWGC